MSIHDEHELKGMERASRLASHLRQLLRTLCVPGATTRELDEICGRELKALGAVSAPKKYYRAPSFAFYSVNRCLVHGLPTDRPLEPGDLVKVDVTPEYEGFVADTACTVVVGGAPAAALTSRLAASVEQSFLAALSRCRVNAPLNGIGRSIETRTRGDGFFVVQELSGHGVGRTIHEEPPVLNSFDPRERRVLTEGLVIAIEPMISSRKSPVLTQSDGWSMAARPGSLTAHHEHTVLVTRMGPVVLTA